MTISLEGLLLESAVVDIEELIHLPDNPKLHSKEYLSGLVKKYGFISRPIINKPTMHIIAGNGRVDDVLDKKKRGEEPPKGVLFSNGKWFIAIDYIVIPIEDEIPLAIAYNRSSELGGWDNAILAKVLAKIPKDKDDVVGFDKDMITAMRAFGGEEENDPEVWDDKLADVASNIDPEKIINRNNGNTQRKELEILRYVVRVDTAKLVRKSLREAMKRGETEDLSDAFELIMNSYVGEE